MLRIAFPKLPGLIIKGLWRRILSPDLFTKFVVLAFASIVTFSAFFAYAFSAYLRQYGEEREASLSAAYVRQIVREHVPATYFTDAVSDSSGEVGGKFEQFFLFDDIFRVKVYNRDGVILWSDEERLIGRSFMDHPLLQRALDGEVVMELEKTDRPEHIFEREMYSFVAEVYVPIFNEADEVVGVVEIYRYPEQFLATTRRAIILIWIASGCGAAILFVSLSKIVHNVHRQQIQMQDALRQKAAELASEKQLLNETLNGIHAGVLVVGPNERVLWTNDTLGEWFPALTAQGPRTDLRELQADDIRRVLRPPIQDVLRGALKDERDCALTTIDGKRRSFQLATSAIRSASGEIVMVIQLMYDVTERRMMEGQLIQTSKLAAVGEMAAKVAHEINNPIGVVSGLVKVLLGRRRKMGITPSVAGDLERINIHADRIAHVVRTLLAFSRAGAEAKGFVDINKAVEGCVVLLGGSLKSSNVTLRLELARDIPFVWADASQLQQVLLNLVNNAVDAMPGGGEIAISTGVRTTGDGAERVWLRVADTGQGIPPEIQSEIFDPFFTTKPPTKGTGLGLSVSQEIIRNHDGSLTLESSNSEGAVFLAELPTRAPQETPTRAPGDTDGGEAVNRQSSEGVS